MKIVTVYFERKSKFRTYLKVFKISAKKTMPKANIEIIKPDMPVNIDHKRDTAFAFIAAAEYALNSKESLAVCDVDLMFIKSIMDIEKKSFDIAVTTRNKMKYNTGLWFYRPSKQSRAFVKEWIKNTHKIVNNFCKYEEFSWKNGGIDQASLALTVKKNKDCKIHELPCLEWNATQSEWKHVTEATRVIHIKSKLAQVAFGKPIPEGHEYMEPLIKKWKENQKW